MLRILRNYRVHHSAMNPMSHRGKPPVGWKILWNFEKLEKFQIREKIRRKNAEKWWRACSTVEVGHQKDRVNQTDYYVIERMLLNTWHWFKTIGVDQVMWVRELVSEFFRSINRARRLSLIFSISSLQARF